MLLFYALVPKEPLSSLRDERGSSVSVGNTWNQEGRFGRCFEETPGADQEVSLVALLRSTGYFFPFLSYTCPEGADWKFVPCSYFEEIRRVAEIRKKRQNSFGESQSR